MITKGLYFLLMVSSPAAGSDEDESTAKFDTAFAVSSTDPSILVCVKERKVTVR